jgi:hypothetical protein
MSGISLLSLFAALQRQSPPAPSDLKVDIALGEDASTDVLAVLRQLDARDVKEVKQRGLSGIETIVVGLMSVKALAGLIVRLLPMWKCGVLVDARGARVVTEKNCDLPGGTVLVINQNGAQTKLAGPTDAQVQLLVKDFVPR